MCVCVGFKKNETREMSAATANLSTAAAATRLCARTADVNGCKNIVFQRGAAVRAPVRAARHPALVVRCNQNNDWPAPAAPPLGEVSSSLQNNQQPRGHLSTERRDLRQRAAEIANIDPNDPRSLDLIGSKTPCKVQFNIPFDTKMGEEVMIIGSHEKLGAWDQANACAMEWSDGGVWRANLELPAGGVFFYKYVVKTLDQGFKWQEGANNLLVLPEPWDIPEGSVFMVDDSFSGLSRSSQNQVRVFPGGGGCARCRTREENTAARNRMSI